MERRRWMTTGDLMAITGMIVLITALALIDWRAAMAGSGLLMMWVGVERGKRGG